MELGLPLEVSPGREATCRAVFGTLGFFSGRCTGESLPLRVDFIHRLKSKRCLGIGFLSRGDREIGVLRNVEPPTRPRLECRRETSLILRCDRKVELVEDVAKINKAKSWFLERINKIDKQLARLIKKQREKNQINKIEMKMQRKSSL